mmetsp:Transcript_122320/g.243491  ORF Transcript_122320/g.243491 Transcript_122320/m.243491 type:complete len:264 (-) Transcript_122320:279-1070(-)
MASHKVRAAKQFRTEAAPELGARDLVYIGLTPRVVRITRANLCSRNNGLGTALVAPFRALHLRRHLRCLLSHLSDPALELVEFLTIALPKLIKLSQSLASGLLIAVIPVGMHQHCWRFHLRKIQISCARHLPKSCHRSTHGWPCVWLRRTTLENQFSAVNGHARWYSWQVALDLVGCKLLGIDLTEERHFLTQKLKENDCERIDIHLLCKSTGQVIEHFWWSPHRANTLQCGMNKCVLSTDLCKPEVAKFCCPNRCAQNVWAF